MLFCYIYLFMLKVYVKFNIKHCKYDIPISDLWIDCSIESVNVALWMGIAAVCLIKTDVTAIANKFCKILLAGDITLSVAYINLKHSSYTSSVGF